MGEVQAIVYRGRVVAAVIAGEAIIAEGLDTHERPTVEAMCLYALDVAEGRRPGPYTHTRALAYARAAAAARN